MAPALRLGTPAEALPVAPLISRTDAPPEATVIRVACPYVSLAGLETLLGCEAGSSWITDYRSEWVVGIHHGITEPVALERLLGQTRTKLRLFSSTAVLSRASLVVKPHLHAKLVALCSENYVLQTALIGSANLTSAAIGPTPRNYEAAICAETSFFTQADFQAFRRWWRALWRRSLVVTSQLVSQYATYREHYIRDHPDRAHDFDPPAHLATQNARFLWIHAGAMSGPPAHRHQIEFAEDLARYFRAPRRDSTVLIQYNQEPTMSRPITFRGTVHGQYVDIWRLGLPTATMGGPQYQNRVIRFERVTGTSRHFRLEVADPHSPAAQKWRREASRRGHVNFTGGGAGREYGLYD